MQLLVDKMNSMSNAIGTKAAKLGGRLDLSNAAIIDQVWEVMNDENAMPEQRMDLIIVSTIIRAFAVEVESSYLACLEILRSGETGEASA